MSRCELFFSLILLGHNPFIPVVMNRTQTHHHSTAIEINRGAKRHVASINNQRTHFHTTSPWKEEKQKQQHNHLCFAGPFAVSRNRIHNVHHDSRFHISPDTFGFRLSVDGRCQSCKTQLHF